ncbi:hypothetical protein GCM10008994_10240 [Halorubrum ejinorense]|uniref:Uncharacterized protein n=1 Tax=Halorubrum ejinorense TaxID=425309 RepID=A0AAV3SQ47_9EURY
MTTIRVMAPIDGTRTKAARNERSIVVVPVTERLSKYTDVDQTARSRATDSPSSEVERAALRELA